MGDEENAVWSVPPYSVSVGGQTIFPNVSTTKGGVSVTPGFYTHSVRVYYDEPSRAVRFVVAWNAVGPTGPRPEGLSGGIGLESVLNFRGRLVELWDSWFKQWGDGVLAPFRPHAKQVGRAYFQALDDARQFGLATSTLRPEVGHTEIAHPEFPETANAVLATLEAEIDMCEDALQRSRLEGILNRLKRLTPHGSAGVEVASAS